MRQRAAKFATAQFFDDMPARIAAAHLVIGRPSILVPLPHSLDNDQKANRSEPA